jgi:hypothetical protein
MFGYRKVRTEFNFFFCKFVAHSKTIMTKGRTLQVKESTHAALDFRL